jgi:DNA-binding NtrC family response regulator
MQRVLVVDDEKNIRFVLAEALATVPLDVDTAASGEEALKLLEQQTYSLMLLDLRMPGMDGIEVLRRTRDSRPELPVVLLTAYGTVGVAVEAMKLGAADFLQKPFDPDHLRRVVKQVLDRQQLDESQTQTYGTCFELAKKRVGERQFDAAQELLRKAIALDPARPEAFNMLGALFEVRHNMPEALKHYRIALELDHLYEAARKNLDRAVTDPGRRGQILLGALKEST